MEGTFIVIDGCEASGKSTLINRLVETLRDSGLTVCHTREPGGTPLGEEVRRLMLDPDLEALSPDVEIMLLLAARKHHLEKVIEPALKRGEVVVCDRYIYSTVAYQGAGKGIPEHRIVETESTFNIPEPDLAVIMDVPVETTFERMATRGGPADRMESLGPEFFELIRQSFLSQAKWSEVAQIVDASGTMDEVFEAVMQCVDAHLNMTHGARHKMAV